MRCEVKVSPSLWPRLIPIKCCLCFNEVSLLTGSSLTISNSFDAKKEMAKLMVLHSFVLNLYLCIVYFQGWQDARSMNMMFDGGRGDGEHWCSCAGTLLWLQRAHMPILMWCPRFPLRLNWQSQRWHLCSCIRRETGRYDKKIKTCDCVCLVFVMLEGIYMYLGKVSHSMSHTLVHRGILKLMAPSFGC